MDELLLLRENIDIVDKQILDLLWKRFDIIKQVWIYKKENNIQPLQINRWQEVLDNAKKYWESKGLDSVFTWIVWNTIHEFALKVEN